MANPLGVLMANILSPQIVSAPMDVRFSVKLKLDGFSKSMEYYEDKNRNLPETENYHLLKLSDFPKELTFIPSLTLTTVRKVFQMIM